EQNVILSLPKDPDAECIVSREQNVILSLSQDPDRNVQCLDSRIPNPESRIPIPESRAECHPELAEGSRWEMYSVSIPESRFPIPDSRIPNPELAKEDKTKKDKRTK